MQLDENIDNTCFQIRINNNGSWQKGALARRDCIRIHIFDAIDYIVYKYIHSTHSVHEYMHIQSTEGDGWGLDAAETWVGKMSVIYHSSVGQTELVP